LFAANDNIFKSLNESQRQAVAHIDGPLMVLAGPGSGKTRVITQRIANLLSQGIPGYQILALTFTNKSAEEMRSRVDQLAPGQSVWVGTFHRFCSRLLRKHAPLVGLEQNFDIFDTDDSRRCVSRVMTNLGIEKKTVRPATVAAEISRAKNRLIEPEKYQPEIGGIIGSVIEQVYPAYQEALLQCNAADFDDLLLHVARLLRDCPEVRRQLDARYRYILVDEYQDTNQAQYIIARSLSADWPNLMVTGDPDQSIYRWRGADIHNILQFENDYPSAKIVRLEQNYRSTGAILEVADQLIANNTQRKEKELFTDNPHGQPVRLTCFDDGRAEAREIAYEINELIASGKRRPKDIAIFYRTNALSIAFETRLRQLGIPYQMVHGLEFYQRREIKDILAYLQLINNPRGDLSFLRIVNVPTRGIGKTSLERLSGFAATHGLSLLDAARQAEKVDRLTPRAKNSLKKFVALFDRIAETGAGHVEEIIGLVLGESGYRAMLKDSQQEEDLDRLDNVEQLLTIGREFDQTHGEPGGLEDFLEQTTLTGDTDDWEYDSDRVTLMTLHASKGLEFPQVYIVATEKGLLPHERSQDTPEELEEERRLFFVGITRAMENLQISLCRFRDFRGRRSMAIPSSFLIELPRDRMELTGINDRDRFQMTDDDDSFTVEGENDQDDDISFDPGAWNYDGVDPETDDTLPVYQSDTPTKPEPTSKPTFEPDQFYEGMMVRHREYGLGLIVATSGSGPKRQATIDFAGMTGRKKFFLEKSNLEPVTR
jgi:ATP-dependent DNA helicase UvrD/PcrA